MRHLEPILHLIEQATGNRHFIIAPRLFVDLLDHDHNAAIFLNRLLYWSERTTDPDGWVYKTYDEWYDELGLTKYQVHRVIWGDPRTKHPRRTLRDFGVEVKVKRAPNGSPVVHYRIDIPVLVAMLVEYLESEYRFQTGSGEVAEGGDIRAEQATAALLTMESQQTVVVTAAATRPDEGCQLSKENTVDDGKATMLTMESEHCAPSSSETKNPSKETIKETSQNDDDDLTRSFEKRFGKLPVSRRAALKQQIERLGHRHTVEVLQRCAEKGGRSWAYALRALENEPTADGKQTFDIPTSAFIDSDPAPVEPPVIPVMPKAEIRVSPTIHTIYEGDKTVEWAWQAACSQLELQLKQVYDEYLRGARLVGFEAETHTFVVAVTSTYLRDMCQHRLYKNVWRILTDVYGQSVTLRFEAPEPVHVSA